VLHYSRNADRTHVEAYLAGRSNGGIQRFEMTNLARVELTSRAQLDLHLPTLPTNDEQRKHPLFVTRAGREEIVDHPGTKERLGLSRRPRFEYLLEQIP
jgi:hypothetical protein